jgi:hypothetical protein
MTSPRRAMCLAVLALLIKLAPSPLLQGAQGGVGQPNWENLKQLSPRQEVKVVQNDAKSFQGNFQSVSDEAIVLHLAAGDQTFPKQNVLRISVQGQGHRIRNALIGAAIGAGVGLGIGAANDNPNGLFPNISKEVFTPVGGLIGAIAGALVPTRGWHEIYRAPQSAPSRK